jgi:hypothetical protein
MANCIRCGKKISQKKRVKYCSDKCMTEAKKESRKNLTPKNTPFKTAGRPTPEGCKKYVTVDMEGTMKEAIDIATKMQYRFNKFNIYYRLSIVTSILSILLASGLVFTLLNK